MLRVHDALLQHPIASPGKLAKNTNLAPATVNICLADMEKLGIVKELTRQKRKRVYSYVRYIEVMNKGMVIPD